MAMASFVSDCTYTSVLRLFPSPISLLHPSSSSPGVVSFPLARTAHPRRLCALRTGPDDMYSSRYRVENLLEVREDENGIDWEDKIFEDTLPLMSYVRMILHANKYKSGDRLSPEHEKTIRERLLPYHHDLEKKIGPGIDYITVGYHPDFSNSRCLFIARTDGQLVDFSYKKCLRGLVMNKYPRHAKQYISRFLR